MEIVKNTKQLDNQLTNFFEYVQNILGVKTILQDRANQQIVPAQASIKKNKIQFIVAVENFKIYTEAETDLLYKMLAAIKMDLSQSQIIELAETQNYAADFVIYFVDQTSSNQFEKVELIDEDHFVQTHSPRTLNLKPELKKVAWEQLQKALPYLQLSTRPKS